MRLHPLSQGLSSFLLVVLLCGLQRRGQQPSCYWKPIVSSLEQSQGLVGPSRCRYLTQCLPKRALILRPEMRNQ